MHASDIIKARPRRPPRLHQVFTSSPLYFVTFGTWDRRPLLANHPVHQAFLSAASVTNAAGNAVGRYTIMPDHIHLFLRVGPGCRLGQAIKCLKGTITKSLHSNGDMGPVWQPGFFDHLLRSSENYAEKWSYVKANPVRAGLIGNADDWPYQGEILAISW